MDFEKLGAFYLGKEYDINKKKLLNRLVMYDARDLTTHAVCVGMTGSGKTGLCIDILEEAAIDNVPSIIIDPKGDITNLLLTFPELRPEDFKEWINIDDARRKGLSIDEFAAKQAELWSNGLKQWGQDGERIKMLKDSADFVIYTPGSQAGIPVSILQSFSAPPLSWETDNELLLEQIQGTVSAILGLIGLDTDPLQSREHIFLSNLFEHFWRQGEDLNLPKLILSIQNPPIKKLGVFDIDTFFPKTDRFELAMNLNNIIAAPHFQNWLKGQPLDIPGFLATPEGKPRHSIFYIAHLNDLERMFFVTILLNQIIAWMRAQPGTTSLRALVYMDEIFGFFPPVANPPSKKPMLTLLKQARAFGVGIVLTTQNPVDLDYKGLTNAGTWFIGRLQTERDKMRVLDGLESVLSETGHLMNRNEISNIISGLEKRVFLLHNVHEDEPVIFNTRWAMSYLRGPLTRTQIKKLMKGRKPDKMELPETLVEKKLITTTVAEKPSEAFTTPPFIPLEIQQSYIPVHKGISSTLLNIESQKRTAIELQEHNLLYLPYILGIGSIHFSDRDKNINEKKDFALFAQPPHKLGMLDWETAKELDLKTDELMSRPEPESYFREVPESINEVKEFKALKEDLSNYLYRSSSIKLLYNPILEIYSKPAQNERDFNMILSQAAREKRDEKVDELKKQYKKKIQKLEDHLNKTEATLEKKNATAKMRKQETYISIGESLLGVLLGRRSTRPVSTTMGKYRMGRTASMDAKRIEETVKSLKEEIEEIEDELNKEVTKITEKYDNTLKQLEEVIVKPRKGDIEVSSLSLTWVPHWQLTYKDREGNINTEITIAY